jgi:hypothetical protein
MKFHHFGTWAIQNVINEYIYKKMHLNKKIIASLVLALPLASRQSKWTLCTSSDSSWTNPKVAIGQYKKNPLLRKRRDSYLNFWGTLKRNGNWCPIHIWFGAFLWVGCRALHIYITQETCCYGATYQSWAASTQCRATVTTQVHFLTG